MPDAFQYDVFLSHSAKDKAVVREVAERLRKDEVTVWFDEWVLKPGDSIPAKIEEGLNHSRVLVLCMSANASGSDWAQLESGTYRFKDPLNKERRFIPLRLDDTPIESSLAQFLAIDYQKDPDRAIGELLKACKPASGQSKTGLGEQHAVRPMNPTPLRRLENSWTAHELHCPCDLSLVRQAMAIGYEFYGRHAISFEQFSDWRAANENVLVSLVDQDGNVLAYFDILPLTQDAFADFLSGTIDEHDLTRSHILDSAKARKTKRLYLAGVAARGFKNLAGSRNASVLIRNISNFIKEFYPQASELFALAATEEGTKLLFKLGFKVVSVQGLRKDGCDLYRYDITPASLQEALNRFKRLDGVCRVRWKKPV